MIDSIIKGFEVWTDAQGVKSKGRVKSIDNISLEGIARLRELIIDLAIRGKLGTYSSTDEPASLILKYISGKREELLKAKLLKAEKIESEIEGPFRIPESWEWSFLGNLGYLTSSSRVHQKDWQESGVPFYRAREIVKLSKDGFVNNELFISKELYNEFQKNGTVPEVNDIMITGVGTIGIPYIVKANEQFYFKDASVLIFKNIYSLYPDYLELFLKSKFWDREIHKNSMGTTVDTLTLARVKTIPVPIPPKCEQKRIVTKVNDLMLLCDKLQEEQTSSLTTHHHIVKYLLEALTQANDADELQTSWEKISQHFDILFCTEDSIEQLKQTILQVAVMGKLVKQNLIDERAKDELKKITQEKEILIKGGKIRKQSPLPEITDKDIKFQIPSNWCLSRLENLVSVLGDGIHGTPDYDDNGDYYFVNGNNLNDGHIEIKLDTKTVSESEFKKHKRNLNERTILVSINGTIGKTAFYNNEKIILGKSACYFNLMNGIDKDYIRLILNTKYFLEYAFSEATGTTIKNVSLKTMRSFVIPLPPFNEQIKIMKAVSRLIKFCDELLIRIFKSEEIKILLSKKAIEMN